METEDLSAQVTPGLLSGHTTIAKAGAILNASPELSMCNLRPHPSCALFVAWNGVITLVFSGFPDSLVLAKNRFDVELSNPTMAADKISFEESDRVHGVVSEWENLEEYLPKVNAPGSRIGSYREGKDGSTCVAFLDIPNDLRKILTDFKLSVDSAFPGRYAWMEDKSLHLTLRSLD